MGGLGRVDAVLGVEAVSRWLRALSAAVVLNRTAASCEDVGHGHGYRVAFRGNVHREGGACIHRIVPFFGLALL